jgi:hypothetical protein
LGGNSKTSVIAAISPSLDSKGETLSTLEFAASAKRVKNKAGVNMKRYVNTEQLLLDLDRIRSENVALKRSPINVPQSLDSQSPRRNDANSSQPKSSRSHAIFCTGGLFPTFSAATEGFPTEKGS